MNWKLTVLHPTIAGAGNGGLGLAIEGPSEAKMTCKDNRDGSCTVEYLPTEAGDYDVSIKFADTHIPGSPFKASLLISQITGIRGIMMLFSWGMHSTCLFLPQVPVDFKVDEKVVEMAGPGIEPAKCRANIPLQFAVDAKKSGKAPLGVEVASDKGESRA